jgi:hypothetical protein
MTPIISEKQEAELGMFFKKYRVVPFFTLFLLLIIISNIIMTLAGQRVMAADNYTLPYPGIMPTNKLYFLKASRDKLLEVFTRDQSKKAELYLLFADKRLNMAIMLAADKKWELSTEMAAEAERYLMKANDALESAKGIGSSPENEFYFRLTASGQKHREVLISLKKAAPKIFKVAFERAIVTNRQLQGNLFFAD